MAGVRRDTTRLLARDNISEPCTEPGNPMRIMSGTLRYTTTHFTEFVLFGQGAFRAQAPDASR